MAIAMGLKSWEATYGRWASEILHHQTDGRNMLKPKQNHGINMDSPPFSTGASDFALPSTVVM